MKLFGLGKKSKNAGDAAEKEVGMSENTEDTVML